MAPLTIWFSLLLAGSGPLHELWIISAGKQLAGFVYFWARFAIVSLSSIRPFRRFGFLFSKAERAVEWAITLVDFNAWYSEGLPSGTGVSTGEPLARHEAMCLGRQRATCPSVMLLLLL